MIAIRRFSNSSFYQFGRCVMSSKLRFGNRSHLIEACGSKTVVRNMTSEVEKAQTAVEEEETVFGKIIKGEIKVKVRYEDDDVLAFDDAYPQAPVHFLVIPKRRISMLEKAEETDTILLGKLMFAAAKIAKEAELEEGYRVVVNNGKNGAQSVYHLHLHVLGGRQLKWPPG